MQHLAALQTDGPLCGLWFHYKLMGRVASRRGPWPYYTMVGRSAAHFRYLVSIRNLVSLTYVQDSEKTTPVFVNTSHNNLYELLLIH